MTVYHYLFILTAFTAVFIQSRSRSYQNLLPIVTEEREKALSAELNRLLKLRRFMSPFIAGLTAVLIFAASLQKGNLGEFLPRLFISVWLLASVGDVFIEGAYSIQDRKKQDRFYLIGMVLFMGMTILLGSGLIINAQKYPLSPAAHPVSILLPLLLGLTAFSTLKLDKETLGPMIAYDLAVSVLLCGGLYSAFAAQPLLACIGIGYFISDWMVGLRDFGKRKFSFLERWNLLIILILYYSIMLLSLDLVLNLG